MFLTNTTPTKQARKTCWVKRGYQQIKLQYMVVGMMLHFRTTCNAIPCDAIISTWVDVVLKVLSVVHIRL